MKPASAPVTAARDHPDWLVDVLEAIESGKPVRKDLPSGGRLHIDRSLPFLCVHISSGGSAPVAREITPANAS